MKLLKICIVIAFLLASCDHDDNDKKYDCIVKQDPWDDTISYIDCPDGTSYATAYGAGLKTGDVVDIEARVDILEVK